MEEGETLPWESSSPRNLKGPQGGGDGGALSNSGAPLTKPSRVPGRGGAGEFLLFLSCSRKDFCECHKPVTWAEPG